MRTSQHRSPIPTFPKGNEPQNKPHPSLPQGEGATSNRLKHSKYELPPLGEGWGGAFTYNLSHTRRKPQHVAMSGIHWLRVITPLSDSELLWFPPRMTLQLPVCGPLGLV